LISPNNIATDRLAYDFHMHSNISDGSLSPTELVDRCADAGLKTIALTDHDSIDGLEEAGQACRARGIRLVHGTEISATWNDKNLHIVGLNIQTDNQALNTALKGLQEMRQSRAELMAQRLEKIGIPNALEETSKIAGGGMITRTHFSHFLIDHGYCKRPDQVFKRYLGQGKPAYVKTEWPTLETVVGWIRDAGGYAIVAHPQRYNFSATKMRHMLGDFAEMGGHGLEVIVGNGAPQDRNAGHNWASRFNLLASAGSDFHGRATPWIKLGNLPQLPAGLDNVAERLKIEPMTKPMKAPPSETSG
jgi:predicted metal-dependent phosphoesterase TrpH